jgi:hypothetical protein
MDVMSIVGQEMCRTKFFSGGGGGGGGGGGARGRITLNTPIESAQIARFDYFDLVAHIRVIGKVMPCWASELHPSFDASSPQGCCPQGPEILLNKGMKYWDAGLNARGANIYSYSIHSRSSAWLKAFRKRKDRAN